MAGVQSACGVLTYDGDTILRLSVLHLSFLLAGADSLANSVKAMHQHMGCSSTVELSSRHTLLQALLQAITVLQAQSRPRASCALHRQSYCAGVPSQ